MCPNRRRARRELLCSWLFIGSLCASACRLGYDEQATAVGGSSGTGANASGGTTAGASGNGSAGNLTSGGTSTSGSGGISSGAGQGPVDLGGSPTSPLGGQPTMIGGAAGASDGGGGVDAAGAAGAAGGGNVPGCQDTVDCSCAANGGHSYWFCSPAVNQANAELHCETQGMHLVRIDSQAENDFLLSQGTATGVIVAVLGFAQIGADDLAVAGEWRWHDGTQFWQGSSSGMAVGGAYAHWANASPGNGAKPCAGMLPAGTWQDRSCTALDPFICESP